MLSILLTNGKFVPKPNPKTSCKGHANINEVTTLGITPLMCAAAWGNLETVKCLIGLGVDCGNVDKSGQNAYELAEEKGHEEVAKEIRAQLKLGPVQ